MNLIAFMRRRENLRKLIADKFHSNRAEFSRAAGVHPNQVNLILSDNDDHRRNLGEGLARRIEQTLSLPHGYFDEEHTEHQTFTVRGMKEVSPFLAGIIRAEDKVHSTVLYDRAFDILAGRITARENLWMARMVSHDMVPDIAPDEEVVIDTGVKAVSTDGVYIISSGADFFLRRITRQLSGGWLISCPSKPDDSMQVDSLKKFKVSGRIVMVNRGTVL